MYNSHFNPDAFPASNSWITGTLTREEMEREHPLELERIESGTKSEEQAMAGGPIPPPEQAIPAEDSADPGDERAPE